MFASKFTRYSNKLDVGEEIENKSKGHPVQMIECAESLVFSRAVCLGSMLPN